MQDELATICQQVSFGILWGFKFVLWAFYKLFMPMYLWFLKVKKLFVSYVMPLLWVVMLWNQNQGWEGAKSYKTKSGTSTMKKHGECEQIKVAWWDCSTIQCNNWSIWEASKIEKYVILWSILIFFNNTKT